MKKSALILILALVGALAEACPKSSSIAGYDDLIRTYGKKNFEETAKRYEALCEKQKGKFDCSSETVAEVRADDRVKELIGTHKCTDSFKIPQTPGMVKLLFLRTK